MSAEPARLVVSHLAAVDGGHTVVLDGELDYQTAPDFVAVLDEIPVDDGARVDLDLAAVPFCDSAGIAALVRAYQLVNKGQGKLRVVAMDPRVRRTLELTGLAQLFTQP
ncbi:MULTISPECIES: STAS domain-containing protein [Actinokineospora]|uniref:Anti-sigma factor antagonist n=1 Tax=Actinokineospora fastidiosa TaxID=1816 RepID=A0A918GF63_9PSEU|nr:MULTISPECIES: STAS domain-containing protein [Actinokineospora]GGS32207.1 anti-sigma factor antagonist [Actinokineospora fastidiosa]